MCVFFKCVVELKRDKIEREEEVVGAKEVSVFWEDATFICRTLSDLSSELCSQFVW